MIRNLLLAILVALFAAGPVLAQASSCAALPEAGLVGQAAADVVLPATPTPTRSWRCPDDFRLQLQGRMPLCIGAGVKAVDGNPRKECYAAFPLGPVAPIAPRQRPTATCERRTLPTVVRIDAPNAGLSDVAISVVPDNDVKMTALTDSSADAPPNENPVLQHCFAFSCRLVKLEVGPRARDRVELRLALPGRDPVVQDIALPAACPQRIDAACPLRACTGVGCPPRPPGCP